ncbi:hypothetical protein [Salinihabitans flavidus]|uniref:hypothetical protein n=1 Tax=Salinihabitans flavidus TaxID=569882 RepID=UPI000B82AC4E|nr:hypothetical protein [Salinihabitans flavidus]
MNEPSLEVSHDRRVEPQDPVAVIGADDPVDGQAHLLRTPITRRQPTSLGIFSEPKAAIGDRPAMLAAA